MDNKQQGSEMRNLNQATREEIEKLKKAADLIPELKTAYQEQCFGVFALWFNLSGFTEFDENSEIAEMREYCTGWF